MAKKVNNFKLMARDKTRAFVAIYKLTDACIWTHERAEENSIFYISSTTFMWASTLISPSLSCFQVPLPSNLSTEFDFFLVLRLLFGGGFGEAKQKWRRMWEFSLWTSTFLLPVLTRWFIYLFLFGFYVGFAISRGFVFCLFVEKMQGEFWKIFRFIKNI